MKRVVNCFKFIGIFLSVLSLVACPEPKPEEEQIQLEKGVEGVEIPAWDLNIEYSMDNLPGLKFDGNGSNYNDVIKENVKKSFANIDVKNVIFMFFDGLTNDLVSSTSQKYNDKLMLKELPVQFEITAPALNENTDASKVLGLLLSDNPYYKETCSYVTNTLVTDDLFRQIRNIDPNTRSESDIVSELVCKAPRPVFLLGIDTESRQSEKYSSDLNDFYKGSIKYVQSFKAAVDCYGKDDVEIPGQDEFHTTKYFNYLDLNGIFSVYPYGTKEFPSPVQSMAFALAYTNAKKKAEGFYVIFHNTTADSDDKEYKLKNFDEAVVAAAKFVLENQDTLLVVTSGALDASKVPVYAFGNVPDAAKTKTNLIDFVKATVKQ